MSKKVVLAGGSGFLGQALGRKLTSAGWEVVVLSRNPRADALFREVAWDATTAGPWVAELDGAVAVVNLAGRSINCVHTADNRRQILESRLMAVAALGAGWAQCAQPPPTWVQCSATGFYGNAGEALCDESLPAGEGFLADVCRQWEKAFHALALPGARRVILRIGVVLDAHHGALPPLVRLTRCFLGGSAGSGRQYLSWIHRDDLLEVFLGALARSEWDGTYNACAPGPVPNAEFMRQLRGVLHRPWVPPAPEFAVRLVAGSFLGADPALALQGQRCIPRRLQAAGFAFAQPEIGPALRNLLATAGG